MIHVMKNRHLIRVRVWVRVRVRITVRGWKFGANLDLVLNDFGDSATIPSFFSWNHYTSRFV